MRTETLKLKTETLKRTPVTVKYSPSQIDAQILNSFTQVTHLQKVIAALSFLLSKFSYSKMRIEDLHN